MALKENVFMLPGPVKVHPRVLDAMNRPIISHRDKEYGEINAEIIELLRYLFQSKNKIAL